MGPHPAVAAVRNAVRHALTPIPTGELVLAACSGGADSVALAAALAFVAPRSGHRAGGVTVDHGLQPRSAERAADVIRLLGRLGLDPVRAVSVRVGEEGGPEAAARTARYAALDETAEQLGAAAVLLGHTRDDQAETVLLGLARGSGARSLAGMPARAGRYVRPFLDLDRSTTRAACAALGLSPWRDPHNDDPAYTRARLRHQGLPALERALGPGVAAALARTAKLLKDDADALDDWARRAYAEASTGEGLSVDALVQLPDAVRRRVLRLAALDGGCPAGTLAAEHVYAVDALLTDWHGQQRIDLPGGVGAYRQCGRLLFTLAEPRARDG